MTYPGFATAVIGSLSPGALGQPTHRFHRHFPLTLSLGKAEETRREIEQLAGLKDWEALRVAAVKLKYLQGIESAAAAWPASVHDR